MMVGAKKIHTGGPRIRESYLHLIYITLIFILFWRLFFISWVMGDGLHYFAITHSLVIDGDLNFTNEYTYLQSLNLGGVIPPTALTAAGLPRNPYPVGMAIIWIPFFLLAHIKQMLNHSVTDGYAEIYFRAVATATLIFSYATLLMIYNFLRKVVKPKVALVSTIVTFICTTLFYYTYHDPGLTHTYSAFFVTLFITYYLSHRERANAREHILLGLIIGFMTLVRWQDAFFMVIFLYDLPPLSSRWSIKEISRYIRLKALMALVALIAFSPQFLFWKIVFGSFFTSPFPNTSFGYWMDRILSISALIACAFVVLYVSQRKKPLYGIKVNTSPVIALAIAAFLAQSTVFRVLFSQTHGLFVWTPITLLSFVGFNWMYGRDKGMFYAFLVSFAVQVYFVSQLIYWHGDWSYGMRFLTNCTIIFATGLAFFMEWLNTRIPLRLICIMLLPFIAWNLLLMTQIHSYHPTIDNTFPFSTILNRQYTSAPQQFWNLLWTKLAP
jgi:hypothetical protein